MEKDTTNEKQHAKRERLIVKLITTLIISSFVGGMGVALYGEIQESINKVYLQKLNYTQRTSTQNENAEEIKNKANKLIKNIEKYNNLTLIGYLISATAPITAVTLPPVNKEEISL